MKVTDLVRGRRTWFGACRVCCIGAHAQSLARACASPRVSQEWQDFSAKDSGLGHALTRSAARTATPNIADLPIHHTMQDEQNCRTDASLADLERFFHTRQRDAASTATCV